MTRSLVLFSLTLFASAAGAVFDTLPRGTLATAVGRDYAAIRDLTLELARAYPPERHYFVNVSQVSTPVIAMLRALYGVNAARNLPLAYLKHLQPPGIRVHCRFTDSVFTSENAYRGLRERLYTPDVIAHLRAELTRALPTAEQLGGRQLVYVEWMNEGLTMANLARELRAFRAEDPARCHHPYTLLGLTHGRALLSANPGGFGVTTWTLKGRALKIFDRRLYRDFAEYGAYEPGSEGPRARPIFDDLVGAYRDRTRRDPAVRAARGEALTPCERALVRASRALSHSRIDVNP